MELSIGQVAKRVGISARMLRHYDSLGLYRPTRVSGNGYRWYAEDTLPKLYRIVSLRRSGIGLSHIAQILSEDSKETDVLRAHLKNLKAAQLRLTELIASIEAQIEQLEDARINNPEEFRASYRSEREALFARLRQKYPPALIDSYAAHSSVVDSMSTAEIEHLMASSATLMKNLATLAANGVSPDSPEAQQGIAAHYEMLTQFVSLSPNAYRSLGHSYIDDPLQYSIASSFHKSLPAWLSHAIPRFVANLAAD